MARTTMKDIAKEAGVCFQSVSEVINDAPYSRISTKTREKIREAAARLKYQPNRTARSLKKGATEKIGVAVGGLSPRQAYASPYLTELFAGITAGAAEAGYKMLLHNYDEFADVQKATELASSQEVDGMLFIHFAVNHQFLDNAKRNLGELNVPYVLIHSQDEPSGSPEVGLHAGEGAAAAARHLLEHGYESFGVATAAQPHHLYGSLVDGFNEALRTAGHTKPVANFVLGGTDAARGVKLADELIAENISLPRALFVTEDSSALGLMHGFRRAGIRVPEDVAIIGFGDNGSGRNMVNELTSVRQPAFEKGEAAAGMLIRSIKKKKDMSGMESVMLDAPLTIRTSCGCS